MPMYASLSLKMFSGVFMARSIGSVPRKLAAVATAVTMRDSSIVMATHRRSPASSRAPKRCDTTTQNPLASPMTKPSTRNDIPPVAPTAASASTPTKRPTIMASTML